jgi:alpha-glucosidase
MKLTQKLCSVLVMIACTGQLTAAGPIVVKSPDGLVSFQLSSTGNTLTYKIDYRQTAIIHSSPLIFSLDKTVITGAAKTGVVKTYTIEESYPMLGAHATARNQCNGAQVAVTSGKMTYTIDIRVFNDGAAFKFIVPGAAGRSRIPDEATVFNIDPGSTVWYHDMDMHYESVHAKKQVAQLQPGEWLAPPATFRLPGGIYTAITEADLKDYSGMSLEANGKNGAVIRLAHHQRTSYPYRLRYSPEDTLRLLQPAGITGTIITPWRVVMIGADLNAMVNNDIVSNLCPPPDKTLFPNGLQTDWIKPGRAVWKYLDGGGEGTVEVMKHFTDGAAALGFEHNILEGFWNRWTDDQIKELVNYSKAKGVSIWFWKHSKSLRDPKARDSFFRRCHNLGVAGAKIDFFDHEAKEVIDLYSAILREGAKYHLLFDFHGANKPTGQARTWPNEMIREAVKGMESSRLLDRATHETTIPFTRMLAGAAEYTVMHFGERRKNTTWAHQIASAAILHAPVLTYAAHPDSILRNPAVEVIKAIPAVWDETIVLPGSEIGELAAFARRKGNDWFIAVMNGPTPKRIKIALNFLRGNYKAVTVNDDPANGASVIMKQTAYSPDGVIELDLVAGGGFVVRIMKTGN